MADFPPSGFATYISLLALIAGINGEATHDGIEAVSDGPFVATLARYGVLGLLSEIQRSAWYKCARLPYLRRPPAEMHLE